MLPTDTHLGNIKQFLTTVIKERALLQRKTQLRRSLLYGEHLQVNVSVATVDTDLHVHVPLGLDYVEKFC